MLKIDIWNIVFTVINLLVLYLFMRHFLIRPVKKILDDRKELIEHDLDEASAAKSEAVQLKSQYEASVAHAQEEAIQLIHKAREQAGSEYNRILDQASADADKKREDADKQILLEREKALGELRASVAGLAMTAAAKLLAQQNSSEQDHTIYDRFLAESGDGHD